MKLKNKIILLVFAFAFTLLFFSNKSFATGTIDIRVGGIRDYTKAQELLQLVNQERNAKGYSLLKMDAELQEAAMTRAAEITVYFSTTRPDGASFDTITSKVYGEHIAGAITNASDVIARMMNTYGNDALILINDIKSIGIGCFKNGNVYYWTIEVCTDNATYELNRTGTQDITHIISVLNENLKIYANRATNSVSTEYMNIGDKGYYLYGIYNKAYNNYICYGESGDFIFTSSNSNVIKINSDSSFSAVGPGTATITISLRNNTSVKYTQTITVKASKPTSITGLKAQNQKTTTLEITWNLQPNSANRYEVFMYNSNSKKFESMGTITSNVGKVYGLISGTTFKFKVRAINTIDGVTYYGPLSGELKTTTATDKTKITKTKGAKKKITVNWKKISKATGYQIQVATDKKFTKNKKSVTISKNKTISTTIKKLKGKKKYYIRVRTYRKVAGKKVYSSWSSVKNVKTK